MKLTFHVEDDVIIRQFSGKVCFTDIVESWQQLLDTYPSLKGYKGILTSYLDADITQKDSNLNVLVEFLTNHLDQLRDLKIAMVMNTPMVTSTIILGQKVKALQIKPFATVEAALYWIRH